MVPPRQFTAQLARHVRDLAHATHERGSAVSQVVIDEMQRTRDMIREAQQVAQRQRALSADATAMIRGEAASSRATEALASALALLTSAPPPPPPPPAVAAVPAPEASASPPPSPPGSNVRLVASSQAFRRDARALVGVAGEMDKVGVAAWV